jgi:hypothetical protein
MPLTVIGTLTLGGTVFTTDPAVYESQNWPKRVSVFRGLMGSVTVQDWGTFKKDNTMRIESGDQYISTSVKSALDTKFRAKGVTYALTDWLGNAFTVFIRDFRPVAARIPDAWRYSMDLVVLDITIMDGVAYTGA